MKKYASMFSLVMVLVLLSGCQSSNLAAAEPNGPASAPSRTTLPTDTVTAVSPTLPPAPTSTTAPSPVPVISQALYFLEGLGEASQVWRLGADGVHKTQITHVTRGIEAFAVSPVGGRLAYVSDNQLFLTDSDGDKLSLIADGQAVDPTIEDYSFRSQVGSPVFSPDGSMLAYGFNGLHLYDTATGEDAHILTNLGNLLGEPFVFVKETYWPGPWSSDGSQLLILMGYYEGSTLAVMDLAAEQPFRRLRSNGPVCCLFNWSADSSAVLVANPYYTGDIPGLWRFDAETGEGSVVVPGLGEDGSTNFVGWPIQLPSGEIYFFHVNQERFSPDVGIPLTMVRSDWDGTHLEPVRPEIFHIRDVLWAPDGSGAVILQPDDEGNVQAILARTDGGPLEILTEAERIRHPLWGP